MSKRKKIIIYSVIGLIFLSVIIFILFSHFIIKKELAFNGFHFKEVTELNYNAYDLSAFVEEVTCEEKCLFNKEELDYSISNIETLGTKEITVKITYQGKVYEKTYEVEVIDKLSPVITLSNEEIEILKNSEFDSKAYITEVTDNYNDLTINDVEIESKVNTKEIGDYTVTYTLIDSNNNIGTASLIVHVVEKIEKNENDDDTKQETNNPNNKNDNKTSNNNTNNSNSTNSNFKSVINSVSLSPLTTRYPDLDNEITSIISSVTNSGMSNYELLQAIYNYVKNKLSYGQVPINISDLLGLKETYSYYEWDAYQVLRSYYSLHTVYGVCDNYAALFMILARRIGFNAYVVGGTVNKVGGGTTGHAWVMIKAGGTYYIFDPQIEDSKGTSYDYFGKTDSELPIYHYTLSTHVNSFKYFKENPNQIHHFTVDFNISGVSTGTKSLSSNGSYSAYNSAWFNIGDTVTINFKASLSQNYTLEILKNDQVISSESYDGSSKTITFTFDEAGQINYDIKIKISNSRYVLYGVHGTVKEPTSTNTTENEA